MRRLTWICVLALGLAIGCGDDDVGDDDDDDIVDIDAGGGDSIDASDFVVPDAGPRPDAAPPPDAPQCNGLANSASEIERTQVASNAPAAAGGTIPEGTFELTSDTVYTGPGGETGGTGVTRQVTMALSAGGTLEVVQLNSGVQARRSFTISTASTDLTLSQTCPGSGDITIGYSVLTGGTTQLLMFAGNRIETYDLQ
jgi:hypothetical protein